MQQYIDFNFNHWLYKTIKNTIIPNKMMVFSGTREYFQCYWKHSNGVKAKLILLLHYFNRILFKLGVFRRGGIKLSLLKLDNLKIYFNLRSSEVGTFKEIFIDKVYEQEEEFIPINGWTVLDLGANIGAFSLRNSSRVGSGRIISFEPNYSVFSILYKNIRENNILNIDIFPLAIGANTAIRQLIVSQFSTGDGSIMEFRYKNILSMENYIKLSVITESLDHFISMLNLNGSIDLIKIDVEGAEYDVLVGAENVLKKTRRIVMEFHDDTLFENIKLKLAQQGFDCIRILQPNKIAYFMKQS